MGTNLYVSATFAKGDNFDDFLFTSLENIGLSNWGCAHKGKNLLLLEQILSFKSTSPLRWEVEMKMAELLPLKKYPFSINTSEQS